MRQLVLASGCIKMCHREQGGRGIKTQVVFFFGSPFLHFVHLKNDTWIVCHCIHVWSRRQMRSVLDCIVWPKMHLNYIRRQ